MKFDKGIWYFILAYLVITLISSDFILVNNVYHGELDVYIPHYLSNLTLGQIIFDPLCELDLTRSNFRGREFGNFLNYIDVQILLLTFKLHIPLFLSVINYMAVLSIAWISIYTTKVIVPKQLKLTYIMIIMLLSSPPIVFSGIFYRANKIVASLGIFIVLAFLLMRTILTGNNYKKKSHGLSLPIIFFGGCIACLSDEQGMVFIVLIALNLILISLLYNTKLKNEIFALISSIIFYYLYINYFGLYLFEYFNNIVPHRVEFRFSELNNWRNLKDSFYLLFRYNSFILGNLNIYGNIGIVIFSIFMIYFFLKLSNIFKKYHPYKIILMILFNIILISLLIHIMTIKHSAILWKDMVTYYCLPILIVLYVIFSTAAHFILYERVDYSKNLIISIFIIIFLNLLSLKFYGDLIVNGHLRFFRSANLIIKSVYSSAGESEELVKSIKIQQSVSGLVPGSNYGENGVLAIRRSLLIKD